MSVAILLTLVCGVAALASVFIRKCFSHWSIRDVVHIPPSFPFGNLFGLGWKYGFHEILQRIYETAKHAHVKYAGIYSSIKPAVLAVDLDLVKAVLVKDMQYFHDQKQRQLSNNMAPDYMFPTIVSAGEELHKVMKRTVAPISMVNIEKILVRFTTDVAGSCAFRQECNDVKTKEFSKALLLAKQFLGLAGLQQDVTTFFMDKNSQTFDEIAADAFVFVPTTMTFTLYELGRNQNIQDKARICVQRALKKYDNQMTYEAIKEMTYITECLNESLRKYPPITSIVRTITQDYTIPDTNVVLPKGMSVIVPVYAIHRDPDHYPKPEVYDPVRFSPENEKKRDKCAFIPFGDDSRACLGMRLGMLQAQVGLAVLLNSFRFEVTDVVDDPLVFTKNTSLLQSKRIVWLMVEKC